MSSKEREFDIWKHSSKIEEMKCPYCNQDFLKLHRASGYEMHFSDSDFGCPFCYRSYPIRPFFTCKTLKEVKGILEKMGNGHRKLIDEWFKETEEKYHNLRNIRKKDYKFNPSKKIKELPKYVKTKS